MDKKEFNKFFEKFDKFMATQRKKNREEFDKFLSKIEEDLK